MSEEEKKEPLQPPLVPDSEYNDTDVKYKLFYNIILPFVCIAIIVGMTVLSFLKSSPTIIFFTLLVMWLFVIYPIYY